MLGFLFSMVLNWLSWNNHIFHWLYTLLFIPDKRYIYFVTRPTKYWRSWQVKKYFLWQQAELKGSCVWWCNTDSLDTLCFFFFSWCVMNHTSRKIKTAPRIAPITTPAIAPPFNSEQTYILMISMKYSQCTSKSESLL